MSLIGQSLGNYRLLKLLGEGGFAEVYLGEHRYLKHRRAVKVLTVPLISKEADRFLQEALKMAASFRFAGFLWNTAGQSFFLLMMAAGHQCCWEQMSTHLHS